MISSYVLALRVAYMMAKTKKTRSSISRDTLSTLAELPPNRKFRSIPFMNMQDALQGLGYAITESSKENHYLIIKISALEGAPSLSCTEKVYKELNSMSTEELFNSLDLPESEIIED